MRVRSRSYVVALALLALMMASANPLCAGEPRTGFHWPIRLTKWFGKSSVDVSSYECDHCGQIHEAGVECIERIPVSECVKGKKTVYDCKVRYEYVSVPEVRYRWKMKWVTKEIPCEGYKPVCKSEDGQRCYGAERWDEYCADCGEVHCKSIEHKTENAPCKYCDCEPGQTTIKVRYKTCVKEPYTVYRQIKRPVCVKQPRFEKVEVTITRHKCRSYECDTCEDCDGAGCASCSQ